ncbi:MAG: hypothetical protein M1830_004819, partial [Pleopsidium flavum]
MTDQAGLPLFVPQVEQPKGQALRDLSLNISSPLGGSLAAASHSDVSGQGQTLIDRSTLRKARKKITELRGRLMRNRLRLKEKRNELREERTRASELDAQFVTAIRQSWEQGLAVNKTSLSGLYQEVQAARDILGPLEDDYNQQEDENDAAEFELNDEEKRFYRLYPAEAYTGRINHDEELSLASSFSSLNSLQGDDANKSEPRNLVLDEYKSRVGDANIIKERLEYLHFERVQYLKEERIRSRIDVKLYPPNQAFLDDFDNSYAKTKQELEQILMDVFRLRQKALEEGAAVEQLLLPATPRFLLGHEPQSRYDEAPALFPEHQSDGVIPDLLDDFAGTRARINRWILDTLNNSPVERAHHKAILSALSDKSLDSEAWARLVFEYWRRDGAATDQLQDPASQDASGFADPGRQNLKFPHLPMQRNYAEHIASDD